MYTIFQQHHSIYTEGLNSSDPYYCDPQSRGATHNLISVSAHLNNPRWCPGSMLYQSNPILQAQHVKNDQCSSSKTYSTNKDNVVCSSNSNISCRKPVVSSIIQHPLPLTPFPQRHNTMSRDIIPSKRAAQNRAAQRAFRQRKECYVKDLEKKAKLMDEWKIELDQLRQQNKELREITLRLERQIHQKFSVNGVLAP